MGRLLLNLRRGAELLARDGRGVEAGTTRFPGKYLSITSFRRDGMGVATPVWFVEENGRLLVKTDADSYKVRRIRRDPRVTIAPCTATGRLLGDPVPARAELLPGDELHRVEGLMARKYRIELIVIRPIRRAQVALRIGRSRRASVILAITPTAEPLSG